MCLQDAPGAVRQPGPGPPARPAPVHQLLCGDGAAPADRPHRLPLHFTRVPLWGLHVHTLSCESSALNVEFVSDGRGLNWCVCVYFPFFGLQVSNYLPSISAAISRVPERYIWRCCVGLHSAPRFLMAATYFSFYRGRFAQRLPELLLSGLALLCSLAENTGLLLLTYVSSTESYSEWTVLFIISLNRWLILRISVCFWSQSMK